jgi:4-amino-4-deoxy-L-arabinose transferase-like glycosyltransferase
VSEWRRAALPGVVLGATIRLTYLATKWSEPLLLNDSLYYSDQAAQLVNGRLFREFLSDQPGAEHGPLTPVLLAPFSWMDNRVAWQRVGTMLFGMGVVVLIARLGWRLGGRRAGVVAGLLAAVYPNLWVSDGLVMSESVSVCVVCAMLLVLLPEASFTPRRAAVAGVLVGLGALARSELVLLAPLVAWLIWRDHRGRPKRLLAPLLTLAAAGLTLLPWVAFNLGRFEDPVLLTTNDGSALLGSYCEPSLRGANTGTWSLFCVLDAPNVTAEMDPSQRSTEYRRQAVAAARANAARLPIAAVARVGRMLDLYGYGAQVRQDTGEERPYWVVWAGIASFLALAPLAVRGLRSLPCRERRVLLLPVVVVLLTTVLFYGGHRIRSSMEPTVVLAAAVTATSRRSVRHLPSSAVTAEGLA